MTRLQQEGRRNLSIDYRKSYHLKLPCSSLLLYLFEKSHILQPILLLSNSSHQQFLDIIPVPLRHVRTTRSLTHSHPFQVSLPTPPTLSHKSSFIPRTCNLWSVLPSCLFPESYNLPYFKSKINKLDLISLSSQPFDFFLLLLLGLCIAWPFLNIIFLKK